jgi:hypothetical protein
MAAETWSLLARSPELQVMGYLDGWELDLTMRANEVGSWSLTVPVEHTPEGWPAPDCGLVIMRGTKVVASGQIETVKYSWSSQQGAGVYEITGDTDLARIAYRVVYPDWDAQWEDQAVAYYTDPGITKAEQLIRRLVNRQCGPISLPNRRVYGLNSGPVAGIGADTTIKERFGNLLDVVRRLALDGGNLIVDIRDTLAGQLYLDIRYPQDLSQVAVFGPEIGNVTELEMEWTAPVATAALLAAQGDKEERVLREYTAQGTRREEFVDARIIPDDEGAELEYAKAAEEVLVRGAEQYTVSATIIDTDDVQWWRDYRPGDIVSISTPYGVVTDLVRESRIRVNAHGHADVQSIVGTIEATSGGPLVKTLRSALRRISQLERAQ